MVVAATDRWTAESTPTGAGWSIRADAFARHAGAVEGQRSPVKEEFGVPVIEVSNLRKRYGEQVAVDGVSFTVEEGEIFGILGPNGAGKTTTVECIAGLRTPDSGEITVLGLDPQRDRAQLVQLLGMQLQESQLPDKLKVGEAVRLYASFYSEPADWRALLAELGLADKENARFGKLSASRCWMS
jgi:ABC-2 type transport system ATP-binding protein